MTSPTAKPGSRVEAYIKDWNWNESSHEFALQMGAFLLEFMDSFCTSDLSPATIRKHANNCWLIGAFTCDYRESKMFTPAIFLYGPGFLHEFERKVSNSKYAVASYVSTWRKLERYVRELEAKDITSEIKSAVPTDSIKASRDDL
jgi:hypothetical protein